MAIYLGEIMKKDLSHKTKEQLIADLEDLRSKLRKKEDADIRLRNLYNGMQDIVFEMDYNGTYLYIAATSPKLLAKPTEDLFEKTLHDVFPKQQADMFLQFIQRCIDENKPNSITYPINLENKTFWFEGRAFPMGNNKVLYFANDITNRKQGEQELIAAKEKTNKSNRFKNALLRHIIYEIRTPMCGINGGYLLLKEILPSTYDNDTCIQMIENGVNQIFNIVNNINDLYKIEAGQVKVVNTKLSINKILDTQYNFFKNEAKAKGLEFNYKPRLSDDESIIFTDQSLLMGILTNLIKNAMKFTNAGSITFGYSKKKLQNKGIHEFYIKDTGIGIPTDRVDSIINRFEQADIDARAIEDLGLGLAISKSYVEMLGGNIHVSSIEGSGSTFSFTITF
jgi:PAS domain S-box-containing protein